RLVTNQWRVTTGGSHRGSKISTRDRPKPPNQRSCFLCQMEGYEKLFALRRAMPLSRERVVVSELELLYAFAAICFARRHQRGADNCLAHHTEFSAKQSLLTARLHRLDFYVVLRELIPKLQAFPESIQETSMVPFYSSICPDDK